MTRRKHPLPEIAWLRERYSYDPETGEITGPKRKMIKTKASDGYLTLNARRKGFGIMSAHRIAFAIMKGHWPKGEIDHINGNRSDNRWINLRDVSQSENGINRKRILPFCKGKRKWHFGYRGQEKSRATFCDTWHLWQESLRHRPACAAQYRDFRPARTPAEIRQARALSQARAKGWREAKAHAAPISATHDEWTQTELPL